MFNHNGTKIPQKSQTIKDSILNSAYNGAQNPTTKLFYKFMITTSYIMKGTSISCDGISDPSFYLNIDGSKLSSPFYSDADKQNLTKNGALVANCLHSFTSSDGKGTDYTATDASHKFSYFFFNNNGKNTVPSIVH